ncbi:hypothetical protein SS50377_27146 [Spironucleus salmonicida]|uniref:Uncharacterized protein n=1 Tax=Spironucleus salmonicida TaxID=348837 RepID=V6LUP2_9EUKA|nr:hypothetical protein SS50377_27146 [Spironucleus salmonicida]|eukprot:EST48347.1 Hypothetical protein SS50377_11481 [Spironucleus salmonicida]
MRGTQDRTSTSLPPKMGSQAKLLEYISASISTPLVTRSLSQVLPLEFSDGEEYDFADQGVAVVQSLLQQ